MTVPTPSNRFDASNGAYVADLGKILFAVDTPSPAQDGGANL